MTMNFDDLLTEYTIPFLLSNKYSTKVYYGTDVGGDNMLHGLVSQGVMFVYTYSGKFERQAMPLTPMLRHTEVDILSILIGGTATEIAFNLQGKLHKTLLVVPLPLLLKRLNELDGVLFSCTRDFGLDTGGCRQFIHVLEAGVYQLDFLERMCTYA